MLSAAKNPSVVEEYLAKELAYGRVIQVDPKRMEVHINRFGVIPKGHQTVKWRRWDRPSIKLLVICNCANGSTKGTVTGKGDTLGKARSEECVQDGQGPS